MVIPSSAVTINSMFREITRGTPKSEDRMPLSGADPSVSCVHAGIVSPTTCTDFRPEQYPLPFRAADGACSEKKKMRNDAV